MTRSSSKHLQFPNLVVLVGRTNVGKSALFNRLIGEHKALVANEEHLTRDLNIQPTVWRGTRLTIVDTGGADLERKSDTDKSVWEKIHEALSSASVILFTTDVGRGLSPFEREWIKDLRRYKKPIVIAANKADSEKLRTQAMEFYQLGIGTVMPVSALSGAGIGDLLDHLVNSVKEKNEETPSSDMLRMAIVGKTNAGKSSLVNRLLGEARMIVSETPHTTREPIDSFLEWKGKHITLIDTAGLRRRAKMPSHTEKIGATRTMRAIERSNLVVFLVDVGESVTAQDLRIAGMIRESRKPMIVVANKWDRIPNKTTETMKKFEEFFRRNFPFLRWAPILFVSAKTGLRCEDIFTTALRIFDNIQRTIPKEDLTRYLRRKLPPTGKVSLRFYGAEQISNTPPTFLLHIRTKKKLPGSFYAYMENRIREQFGFEGSPMEVSLAKDDE